jgi:hypothetical protein
MASPGKALADALHADRGTSIRSQSAMRDYLSAHLRVDLTALEPEDIQLLALLAKKYRSRKIKIAADVARQATAGSPHE